ncbi:hypothetical protein RIR_jg130.t1 [Rhizophagus irregularis DAOM 181602=DAOM 197198]|nr:hypothetical protein RIR_jg130.t1 [Rhizophagus irregularis DAOM 181602=DAOM 197198]
MSTNIASDTLTAQEVKEQPNAGNWSFPILDRSHQPIPYEILFERKVTTFPSNAKGFKKMVNMPIGHYMDEVLYNKVPATIVLVAGDAGFKSILQTTVQLELMEIYFWETDIEFQHYIY